jgi:hypothetical protein
MPDRNEPRSVWTQLNWLEQASNWIDRQLHRQNIKRIDLIKGLPKIKLFQHF